MTYDGEIISINLDTNFYHIRYSDRDEKDMTVSVIRKFGLPKRLTKRKEVVKTTNNKVIQMNDYMPH